MKVENIKKLLEANLAFIENEDLQNIETEIKKGYSDRDMDYVRAMRSNHAKAKQEAKTLKWVLALFDKPRCFTEPNEMCSSSHPETDEDCPHLKECMLAFNIIRNTLSQTVKTEEKK